MLVGCSEISTSVTVKHAQQVGIIRAFCLLQPGGTEKNCWLWFTRGGISTQADTIKLKNHRGKKEV